MDRMAMMTLLRRRCGCLETKFVSGNSGMTLVEVLTALAIGSIVGAAVLAVHQAQVKGQATQEAVLEMQQGVRAALTIMEREIRSAGADPSGNAGAAMVLARSDELRFTRDIVGRTVDNMRQFDGDTDDEGEDIRYAIAGGDLVRCDASRATPCVVLLPNVDALNFVYLNREGGVIAAPVTGPAVDDIRQVQISIVARYGLSRRGMLTAVVDNVEYRNQRGDTILSPPNDTFRRLMMATNVTCRNIAF